MIGAQFDSALRRLGITRRITESFSKAVEQLGSDKLEVRLGGTYSLERISKESLIPPANPARDLR
jgi:hypothetical protein